MMVPEPMFAKLQMNISLHQVMYSVLFVISYIHGIFFVFLHMITHPSSFIWARPIDQEVPLVSMEWHLR